jgi:hypothetical protein
MPGFYQRNSWGIDPKNDVFLKAARAGGERAIGLHLGAHQVSGIPSLHFKMCSRIILFHLRHDEGDMPLLRRAGIKDEKSPEGNYVFRHWTIEPGGQLSEPFTGTLELPESYLKQLSAT